MVAKDFTDYIIEVQGGDERVYYRKHIRQLRKDEPIDHIMNNGYKVILNKDRAFVCQKYKNKIRKFYWNPIRMIYNLGRSKKVGLLKYFEPKGPYVPIFKEVSKKVPVSFKCKICKFESDSERGMKSHVSRKHKGAKFDMVAQPTEFETVMVKEEIVQEIHPYHMSKIHQPTGLMVGSKELAALPADSVLRTYTPVLLKKEIENELYKKAVNSVKYGELKKVTQNWWVWVIVAAVVVIVMMVLSGNLGGAR